LKPFQVLKLLSLLLSWTLYSYLTSYRVVSISGPWVNFRVWWATKDINKLNGSLPCMNSWIHPETWQAEVELLIKWFVKGFHPLWILIVTSSDLKNSFWRQRTAFINRVISWVSDEGWWIIERLFIYWTTKWLLCCVNSWMILLLIRTSETKKDLKDFVHICTMWGFLREDVSINKSLKKWKLIWSLHLYEHFCAFWDMMEY